MPIYIYVPAVIYLDVYYYRSWFKLEEPIVSVLNILMSLKEKQADFVVLEEEPIVSVLYILMSLKEKQVRKLVVSIAFLLAFLSYS